VQLEEDRVRCSSCEPLLDAFVDADLDARRTGTVAAHLRSCTACEALRQRLRVVDALLVTASEREIGSDFTAAVMSAVRDLPAPQPPRRTWLLLAAFYLVGAWIVGVAAFALLRPSLAAGTRAIAGAAGSLTQGLAVGTHALLPIAPIALPAVAIVLAVDVLLFAALVFFYRRVRPRLTAYLTAPVEAL